MVVSLTAGELPLQVALGHVEHRRATVATGARLGRSLEVGDEFTHLRQ